MCIMKSVTELHSSGHPGSQIPRLYDRISNWEIHKSSSSFSYNSNEESNILHTRWNIFKCGILRR
jgi:hypothetical protein